MVEVMVLGGQRPGPGRLYVANGRQRLILISGRFFRSVAGKTQRMI